MKWKSDSQRKILGKTIEIKMVKFNQKLFPKSLFFDFPNPSKNTKKIVQFKFKNFFLIAAKTPESMEKFAQKIFLKNSCKWGIYRQIWKIAVGSRTARNTLPVDRTVDRPTVNF